MYLGDWLSFSFLTDNTCFIMCKVCLIFHSALIWHSISPTLNLDAPQFIRHLLWIWIHVAFISPFWLLPRFKGARFRLCRLAKISWSRWCQVTSVFTPLVYQLMFFHATWLLASQFFMWVTFVNTFFAGADIMIKHEGICIYERNYSDSESLTCALLPLSYLPLSYPCPTANQPHHLST